jgi:hypothetical protein
MESMRQILIRFPWRFFIAVNQGIGNREQGTGNREQGRNLFLIS